MTAGASPGLRKRALVSVIDLATTTADENQVPEPTIVSWLASAPIRSRSPPKTSDGSLGFWAA